MLGQTSRMSSSPPNKEQSSIKRMSENERILILIERLYLTNTLRMQYFISTDITYLQPVLFFWGAQGYAYP
jgi:hypothetical protein